MTLAAGHDVSAGEISVSDVALDEGGCSPLKDSSYILSFSLIFCLALDFSFEPVFIILFFYFFLVIIHLYFLILFISFIRLSSLFILLDLS